MSPTACAVLNWLTSRHHEVHKFITTDDPNYDMLARMVTRPPVEILRAAGLEVHPSEFLTYANGQVIMLTRKEQQMLATMMRNEGRIVGREELFAAVWGAKMRPGDRSVDVYVRKLRARLAEVLPEWKFIHTHFGFGYRFDPQRLGAGNASFTSG